MTEKISKKSAKFFGEILIMSSKKKLVKIHFQKRSLERVGVLLNEKIIIDSIQKNKLEFIERQSNRITVWRYIFMDKKYRVVYDKTRKQIVTILNEN